MFSISANVPIRLTVSPRNLQQFKWRTFSLICIGDKNLGWRVMSNTSADNQKPCGTGWGKPTGLTCTITYPLPWDSGAYWCQDWKGRVSNVLEIVVSNVILESSVFPVEEGTDISLGCAYIHDGGCSSDTFYKDGDVISMEPQGHLFLTNVSKANEGVYSCETFIQSSPPTRLLMIEKPKQSTWVRFIVHPATSQIYVREYISMTCKSNDLSAR